MRSSFRYVTGLSLASLSLILYVDLSHISHISEHQAWRPQYSTANHPFSTSSQIPTAVLDILPTTSTAQLVVTIAPASKIIVMAKLEHEDTSWVAQNLPDWQTAIYTVDNPNATLHTNVNKGREANAYLTYIVQNYESLPDTIVFLHSHRGSWPEGWHNDAPGYDNVLSIETLRMDSVQRDGYVNLRCVPSPGCPVEIEPFRDPQDVTKTTELQYGAAWKALFGNDDVPPIVGVACCSQFAVSKSQVLSRAKTDYEWYLRWLLETDLHDDISGRILEYMWHIIFGQGPVFCPSMPSCYCNVYGQC